MAQDRGVVSFHHVSASLTEANLLMLRRLSDSSLPENAGRGQRARELLGATATITNPRSRLLSLRGRRFNLAFALAEFLWHLSGSRDVAFLRHYAPRIGKYAPSEDAFDGTAYGPIMRGRGGFEHDQLAEVMHLFHEDPETKRAIVSTWRLGSDLSLNNRDVPCTLAFHFRLRENALHCITYMRANDAYRGFPTDAYTGTMLQELVATEVGAHLGTYTHMVGTLHLYADDWRSVEAITETDLTSLAEDPPMDDEAPLSSAEEVAQLVRDLQQGRSVSQTRVVGARLPRYWRQVLEVFIAFELATRPAEFEHALSQVPEHWGNAIRDWFDNSEAGRE